MVPWRNASPSTATRPASKPSFRRARRAGLSGVIALEILVMLASLLAPATMSAAKPAQANDQASSADATPPPPDPLATETPSDPAPAAVVDAAPASTPDPTPTPTPDPTPTPVVVAPTIASDLPDYSPGQLVTLTGSGWSGDSTVTISVNDDAGNVWHYSDTSAVSASGTILDTFNLPTSFIAQYYVTATGAQTGRVATSSFTDAAPPSVDGPEQCDPPTGYNPATYTCAPVSPIGWTNGNNNGPYAEGETVPYRLSFDNLLVGDVYAVRIGWDTSKSGKHALDYLKSYNATVTGASACVGLAIAVNCSGASDTLAIPVDSIMQSDPEWSVNSGVQDAGVFTMFGGDLTATSGYTLDRSVGGDVTEPPGSTCTSGGCYAGDTTTFITVTFTAQADKAMVAWGGHIAERDDWGTDNSAIAVTGSPYHMRFASWRDVTSNQTLNGGNADRSLSAEAVIYPGSITIVKQASVEGATSFAFTASPAPLSAFSLVDDGADATTPFNAKTFSNILAFGTYTVIETPIPSGWSLGSIACVDPTSDSTTNPATATASIDLAEGESITCTFTNNLIAVPSIDVEKLIWTGTTFVDADAAPGPSLASSSAPVYKFVVTNTGNVTLGSISLSDSPVIASFFSDQPLTTACSIPSTLAAGGSITCYGSLAWAAGQQTDTATASGTFSGTTYSDTDDANYFGSAPAFNITKDASVPDGTANVAGEVISYTISVANTGNVTLTGVSVTDPFADAGSIVRDAVDVVGDEDNLLEVGETWGYTASHTVTQAELDAGGNYDTGAPTGFDSLRNVATAHSNETPDDTDDAIVPVAQTKSIDLLKTAGAIDQTVVGSTTRTDAGDQLTYTFKITNTGNVTLTGVDLDDALVGRTNSTCTATTLAPGAFTTCTSTYTLTQADINAGSVTNNAEACGDPPTGTEVCDTDTTTTPISQVKSIDVEKYVWDGTTWQDADSATGPTIVGPTAPVFKFTVTNTGNVTLGGIALSDSPDISTFYANQALSTPCVKPASLLPGGTFTCYGSLAWAAGQQTDTATASGTFNSYAYSDTDPANYIGKVQVNVLKTVNGKLFSGPSLTFELRTGAAPVNGQFGTVLETQLATVANGGQISFATLLVPGTYQLCEIVPEGYVPSYIWGTYGVDWFKPGYAAGTGGLDPNILVCVNFTIGANGVINFQNGQQTIQPGGNILINNQVGQMPRTIGYWKNHAASKESGGGQAPILDRMLCKATQAGQTITIGTLALPGCSPSADDAGTFSTYAVRLLNKSTIDTNKKQSSDPCFNVAAQLLAYRLNQPFGAWPNSVAASAADYAQQMLVQLGFGGKANQCKATTKGVANLNYLNGILDAYNNDTLAIANLAVPYPGIYK
jgi:uncharacterized repeat protein (TIGR01451 family)